MTKAELKILEKAYACEINDALTQQPVTHLLQTKSKLAIQLAERGFLKHTKDKWRGVTFEGYELTHAGRLAYCASTDSE
jgi:hypothetical protein